MKYVNKMDKCGYGLCNQYPDYYDGGLEMQSPSCPWDYQEYMGDMMYANERLTGTVQDCEATCEHMIKVVLNKQDIHMRRKQAELLMCCADICNLMAKYLARDSRFSKPLANCCARVCETCGTECSRFSDMDSQQCAQVCLNCAEECRTFASQ